MYKIISVIDRFNNSRIVQNTETGKVTFIDKVPSDEINKYVKVVLYVIAVKYTKAVDSSYFIVDNDGKYQVCIADTINNDKPNIPRWLIKEWMENPEIQFNVHEVDGTLEFGFPHQTPVEFSIEENNFIERSKVSVDDFKVVRLNNENDFLLKHISSGKFVFLEHKHYRDFFSGNPYQVHKVNWDINGFDEEVLVLRPFCNVVVL